jgi:hypothetical protein
VHEHGGGLCFAGLGWRKTVAGTGSFKKFHHKIAGAGVIPVSFASYLGRTAAIYLRLNNFPAMTITGAGLRSKAGFCPGADASLLCAARAGPAPSVLSASFALPQTASCRRPA